MDASRLEKEALKSLKEQNVQIFPYEAIFQVLQEKARDCKVSAWLLLLLLVVFLLLLFCEVWLDQYKGNMALYRVAQSAPCKELVETACPISLFKAIKNEKEVQGAKNAHIRDAAALVTYFAWLEHQIANGNKPTECEAADVLDSLRSKQVSC